LKPNYAEAHMNLALAFVHEKAYPEALTHAKQAVAIAPNYGDGWLALCNIAEQCKDYQLALEAGKRNTELLPNNNRAWFGYGVALNRVDRNEEAVTAYKRALELMPDRADIWDNLAQTYQSLNWLDEAEQAFHKTIAFAGQTIADEDSREIGEGEYGNRHWHLALMELLRGKYKKGFARYRARFGEVGGLARPNFSRPLWQGEDLNGKTLVICDEQGFGDTLMLARYLPLLKQRGARLIFSVHEVLKPLFENWPVIEQIVTHGDTISNYDYYASVFDLPLRFSTELDTIPAAVPYLPVLPPDAATHLEGDSRLKVGVVWGGSPLHSNDSRRSIPLKLFSGIFTDNHYQFFSLNRDLKPGDAELLPHLAVTDLTPRLKNFADGARLIGQLDLVITCDTATAHLAGGLGIPVWVLLPFAPDWRWLTDRPDSPWYPTARLFRQPRIGDWQSVIDQVKQALTTQHKG
jgi:ADP-heptose:LPS heptosyltransferase